MPLALILVIADKRAYHAERVVFKQHISRLVYIPVEERSDDLGNSGAYRAALLAGRVLAVEAAARFLDDIE